jgi:predicted nucleotidyltransferase
MTEELKRRPDPSSDRNPPFRTESETGSDQSDDSGRGRPSQEELRAELLPLPDAPERPSPGDPPGMEQILAAALRYVRGKRGGDLLAVLLVGSGVRRALTTHSDIDLIVLVKGQDEGEEVIRIAERHIDIRYRGHKAVEQELSHAPRLPPLLRKGRVLFEHEAFGTRIIEKANQRFRQGPPPADLNEKIRLKVDTLHWLGKASDLAHQAATAQLLLTAFLENVLQAFFRLRGYWLTAPTDVLRFVVSRDAAIGQLLERFLTAPTIPDRIAVGRQLVDLLFKDIPAPPRVD